MLYEVITVVIGAGMSGLAASIRLAMYDRSVLLLERHLAPGGLNSFYRMGGHAFDVGLHALTNWVPPGAKGTPLGKIFRQLRIERDAFDLCPQLKSARITSYNVCYTKLLRGGTLRDVTARHRDRRRFIPVTDSGVLIDIDTPADYEQVLRLDRSSR